MIAISRRLAKQLRVVMRRALGARARQAWPALVLQTGPTGLCIQVTDPEVSIEYREAGSFADERILLPASALDDFQGANDSLIQVEATGAGTSSVFWDDAGVPLFGDYAVADPEKLPAFPATPQVLVPVEAGFLQAFHDASTTAAKDEVRPAHRRLQLRGAAGEIIATDGRQLLIQQSYSFPWKEDVLVTAIKAFDGRAVPWDEPVTIGRTDAHVVLRTGSWMFCLAIDAGSRYPDVHCVVPMRATPGTTWRLTAEDRTYLIKALPRMPGSGGGDSPVTVDLNGHASIRAKAEGQGHPTEIALDHSEIVGPPVRFCANRLYLTRAAQLGFAELHVIDPEKPIVCRDERRIYVWVPLPMVCAIEATENSLSVPSDRKVPNPSDSTLERKESIMTTPTTNGTSPQPEQTVEKNDSSPLRQPGINGLIEEAEALKTAVREDYERASRLAAGLRRHRKQSKLMSAALVSLRQLQSIAE